MLTWKEEYSIGIEMIDQQHKRLFEIGNDAYNVLNDPFTTDKFDKVVLIIEDLREYTKFHFRAEEGYMLKIGYKKYFSQKVEHDDFIAKLDNIDLMQIDENPEKHLQDILKFVFDWILDHILQKDRLIKSE